MNKNPLFSELTIGNVTIKNRIAMAPMGTTSDGDGGYSPRTIRYFSERAKGGFGLIITGMNAALTDFEAYTCSRLDNWHHVNRLTVLCEQVHQYGAKVCVQLGPGGGRQAIADEFTPPHSASAIPSFWFKNLICTPFTTEEVKYLIDKVGKAAKHAKLAGADMVEIHGYGSYLIDQFLSAMWNKRTDEFGGDLKGRMKIATDIIKSIQTYCGKDFPIIFKYTPNHANPQEGYRTIEEGIEMAKIFEEAGCAALHVDKGCYEVWYKQIPTVYASKACQIDVATEIKKHVSIPVIGHGKLNDPVVAQSAIENGNMDMIALGHQAIADPDWPNKVRKGKLHEIRPCVGCNECLHSGRKGRNYVCAVNPQAHHEDDFALLPGDGEKKVLVIGGGPGGMQAAITAAEKGYKVDLWEKSTELGGLLLAAGAPSFKYDVKWYVEYATRKVYSLGVNVCFGKKATAKDVLAGGYDKVLVATGSTSFVPPIPGVDKPLVAVSTDILRGFKKPEGPVVVIGGGLVGCETALFCNEDEAIGDVTVVEMLNDILAIADHCPNNDMALRAKMKESTIKVHCGAKVTAINDDSVTFLKGEEEITIPAATVIIASGYRADNALAKELKELIDEDDLYIVGDCVKPGKIIDATRDAYQAIRLA